MRRRAPGKSCRQPAFSLCPVHPPLVRSVPSRPAASARGETPTAACAFCSTRRSTCSAARSDPHPRWPRRVRSRAALAAWLRGQFRRSLESCKDSGAFQGGAAAGQGAASAAGSRPAGITRVPMPMRACRRACIQLPRFAFHPSRGHGCIQSLCIAWAAAGAGAAPGRARPPGSQRGGEGACARR
jgi:hypothetical protein